MRNLIILLFLTCINSSSFSQEWQWAKVFGSEFEGLNNQGEDYLQMEVDDSGNVYICGLTWPEAYFDGDTLYHNSNDTILGSQVFLAKYDCSGNRKWIRHFGNLLTDPESRLFFALNEETGHIMTYCWVRQNDIYFQDTIIRTSGRSEIVVIYDLEGNRVKFPPYFNNNGPINFVPEHLKSTETGFVFMGESRGGATFPTDSGFSDTIDAAYPLIVHLDSNGLYQKHVVIENEKFFDVVERRGFTLDKDENYYFTGTLNDRGDSLVSGNVRVGRTNQWANGIIARYNNNGTLDWFFKSSGTTLEGFYKSIVKDDGSVVVGGSGAKDVILDQDTFYQNGYLAYKGLFFAFLDPDGNYEYSTYADDYGLYNYARNFELNNNGNLFVFGDFLRKFSLGGNKVRALDTFDLYLAEFDVQNKMWTSNMHIPVLMQRPSDDLETPFDMAIDGNGSIYMLGTFNKALIFKGDTLDTPSTGPFIGDDGFLMKYGVEECPTPVIDNSQEDLLVNNPKVLKVFPNPSRGSFQLGFSEEVEGEVQIFSYDGRLVYHQTYKPSENINLDVPSGIYLVSLQTSEGERFGAKVVVE